MMSLGKHLEKAADRLKDADSRIAEARTKTASLEQTREWLDALSDFSAALSDIQRYTNESVHEKLRDLAQRVGFKSFSRRVS